MPRLHHFTAVSSLAWLAAAGYPAGAEEPATETAYAISGEGTRVLVAPRSGVSIKLLVEAANLGGSEVELGEITFPAGYASTGHGHGSVEIFYVLEGSLEHVVNGDGALLTPGQVGIVRPGDSVIHRVIGDSACRALVIWAPGGEAARLARYFEVRPIDR